jgi:V/A-type H+-transporting ATPase subunit I
MSGAASSTRAAWRSSQSPSKESAEAFASSSAAERLRAVKKTLGLEYPETIPPGTRLPGPEETAELERIFSRAAAFEALWSANAEKVARTRDLLEEARSFAALNLPYREIDHLSFLALRIGHLDPSAMTDLALSLGDRALILPVDNRGLVVAATTKKGRFALDTELSRSGFKPHVFPPDFEGVPSWLPERLEKELAALASTTADLDRSRACLASELAPAWRSLAASYAVFETIEGLKKSLDSSARVFRLEGWIPRDRLKATSAALRDITEGRLAIRAWTPRELRDLGDGEVEVPVLLKKIPYVSSFERLVLSYGTPIYGTVDPTPFVAFFFTLLFSIMFGDMGQGALILLAGILLRRGVFPRLAGWKPFAPIAMGAGIGSMFMGLLTGSLFANETWLVPLERILTSLVLGHPADRFLVLLPQGGTGIIMAFFGFTLAIGVVVNSVGLALNVIDRFRTGQRGEGLFSKTGLCGAVFFLWAVGIGVRALLGDGLYWFDAVGLGLPIFLMMFEVPLASLVDRRPAAPGDGAFAFAIGAFVTILESVSYFLSTSLSFLRVGAFALSHVVLSFIVFTMGDLIRERAPGGLVWEIVVVLLGNAIILFLEGMIVAIQIVRLQYYEFLSKFLTETGRPFAPLKFKFAKE